MQYSAPCSRAMQYSTPCSREGISRVPPWVSNMMDAPLDDPCGFNSKKSAASSRDRHIREKHKRDGAALAVRRKQRDARAHQVARVHYRVQGAHEEEQIARHEMRRSKTEIIPTEVRVPVEMRPRPSCAYGLCRRRANYPCDRCEDGFCWFHLGRCSNCGLRSLCPDCIYPAEHGCVDSDSDTEEDHAWDVRRKRHASCAGGWAEDWMAGIFTRNEAPRYGCHLLSFSPASTIPLDQLHKQHHKGGLPAFDAVLHHLARDNAEVIYVPPSPLASQAAHAFMGRR